MSTTTISAFISSALLSAILIGGCAGGGTRTTPQSRAEPDDGSMLNDTHSPEVLEWADQAQRDVDDFLALRDEAQRNAGDAESPSSPTEPASGTPGPPRILWNQPARPAADQSASVPGPEVYEKPFIIPPMATDAPELEAVADPTEAAGGEQIDPLHTDRLNQLMVELSAELRRTAADSEAPLPYLLAIAGMALADAERTLDPESLYDLSEEERELFARLQEFFAHTGRDLTGCADAKDVVAEAVAALRESLAGELTLPTAELCYSVTGFGIYKTFNKYAFLAHQGQQVIVYLEIDDFESELNKKGQWVTETSQLLTIYGDDGLAVWGGRDWATAVDAAHKRRRDFFTVQTITLPDALSVGKYTLKIRVRDEKTGAEAERSIPFEMVADSNLAARIPGS